MRARRTILRCSLAALLALTSAAQQRPAEVQATIARVLEGVTRPVDILRASNDLARLGLTALEPLFDELCANAGSDAPLGRFREEAVLGALGHLSRKDVVAFLQGLARTASDDGRRAAGLELLGRFGGRDELKLAMELGTPSDPTLPPGPALQAAVERALLGLCDGEQGAVRSLAAFFPRVSPAARAAIAKVVARVGGEEAAGLLVGQLGAAGVDADMLLLLELGRIAGRPEASEDLLVLERVRGMLGHPDARLRVLACMAVEKLRDHAAVPDLVVMLEDSDPNLRQRAHAALVSLTRLTLAADSEGWLTWLAEGLTWWDERAEPCRIALVSGTATEAAASVRELARQRLFVHDVVAILALALVRPEPDIVRSACRVLGTIPERAAFTALLPLVAHPDPAVVAEVKNALQRHEHARPSTFPPSPNLPRLRSSL